MITYNAIQADSLAMREANDCSVCAVSVACQIPYKEAHEYLRSLGRPKGRGWYWRTHLRGQRLISGYVDNLKRIGFEHEQIEFKSKTVATIGKELREGHYLVHVKGHVLALVNGKVEDWSEGRRHRILNVVRIKNPRNLQKIEEPVVISPTAPKGFRKLRHKKAARLGLDPKTGLPLNN
jgi:hypothetical protein